MTSALSEPMRVCMRCKVELPLALYPMIGAYHSVACPSCFEPRPHELDHRPAVRMRVWLARRRRAGLEWDDQAYEQLIPAALAGLRPEERVDWPKVLRWSRAAWEAAYTRSGTIVQLTVDVFDD